MAKDMINVKKEELENILQTRAVEAYFYFYYWELNTGKFDLIKTYPAGTLSVDDLDAEIDKLYEENYDMFEECKRLCDKLTIMSFYIGYFDDEEEDFHIVARRKRKDEEE